MRLTDDEKRAIRSCFAASGFAANGPWGAESCYYGLKNAAGYPNSSFTRLFDGPTDEQAARLIHLMRVESRTRRIRNAIEARKRAIARQIACQRAEAHGYRPEYV